MAVLAGCDRILFIPWNIYGCYSCNDPVRSCITLAVGQVTPPYGLCLLIAGRISGMSVQKSFKAVIPYIMVSVVVVVLIAFLPDIAFALPKLIKPEWF